MQRVKIQIKFCPTWDLLNSRRKIHNRAGIFKSDTSTWLSMQTTLLSVNRFLNLSWKNYSMLIHKYKWLLLYLSVLQIISIVLFLYGFFPERVNQMYSTADDIPRKVDDLSIDVEEMYSRKKTKVVLMVIDALRYDFISERMPFLFEELKSDHCLLKGRVEPPTVTLPRIKSLMTGSIPSFYDVVTNFGSVKLNEDNIVSKAVSSKMNVVFYGDDTWLKLFPDVFLRSEGTSSFYVNDFFEVDKNVTRHLDFELNSDDWDVMILHYLGLDHIGHVEGPFGSHIKSKLAEMDEIMFKIQTKLVQKNPSNPGIFIICGDHGMKDSGGHGGTSLSEILVPIVLLNYKCDIKLRNYEVKQVDLVPLLSTFLALPIPGGSVGKLNFKMLSGLDIKSALFALHYNTLRMYNLFKIYNPDSEIKSTIDLAIKNYRGWILSNYSSNDYLSAASKFSDAQNEMSSIIISNSISFDDYLLLVSVVMMFQVILLTLYQNIFFKFNTRALNMSAIIFLPILTFHWFSCYMSDSLSKLCVFSFPQITLASFVYIILFVNFYIFSAHSLQKLEFFHVVLMAVLVLNLLALTSSSFVEEEHQFWYFATATISIYLLPFNYGHFFVVLSLHAFLRKMNQTGDKWAHLSDIGDWLSSEENQLYLTVFFIFGLYLVFASQMKSNFLDYLLTIAQLALIFLYKVSTGSCTIGFPYENFRGILEARIFWAFTIFRSIFLYFSIKNEIDAANLVLNILISIISLISKPHNIILIPSIVFFSSTFSNVYPRSYFSQSVFHYMIGSTFYFYQGNSNSIANIDVSAGYTGLEEYNIILTGFYIFMNMYSGHILSFVLMQKSLITKNMFSLSSCFWYLFISSLSTFFYMIVITIQRYHLFVWSVFAPKLMFISAQAGLFSSLIIINNLLWKINKI